MKNSMIEKAQNVRIYTKNNDYDNTSFWCWLITKNDEHGNAVKNQFGEFEIRDTDSGIRSSCICTYCVTHGNDIPEIYATWEALFKAFVNADGKKVKVTVFTSSKLLGLAARNPNKFVHRIENSGCDYVTFYGESLLHIMSLLDVEIKNPKVWASI